MTQAVQYVSSLHRSGGQIRGSALQSGTELARNIRGYENMNKRSNSVSALHQRDARQSPRRWMPLDAQIRIGSARSCRGQVQNISSSGVFVRGTDVALDIGAAVEFVLHCHRKGPSWELRVPATVTRLEREGVALRFGRYDSVVYTELIDVIYNTDRVA